MILSSDKSSERNLSSFFDIKKPRRIEHLQSEDPYFKKLSITVNISALVNIKVLKFKFFMAKLNLFDTSSRLSFCGYYNYRNIVRNKFRVSY